MSNAFELAEAGSVVVQNRTEGTTTFNEVGGILFPVGATADRPAGLSGMFRFNTSSGLFECYNGTEWVIVSTSSYVNPANVSASPAFASGTGTSGDPYVITSATTVQGEVSTVATVTVTGLLPFESVAIFDENATINGGRYSFSNTVANVSGVLVFDIIFTDTPASVIGSTYTLALKIGLKSAFVRHIRTSVGPPGETWVDRISGTAQTLYDVAWSGSTFVAVGLNGTLLTSPNGNTWTTRTSGTTAHLFSVTWSGTQFVVVGNSGTIITSPDGITWTTRTSGVIQQLNSVVWNGSIFLAAGQASRVLTSPNGITWTDRPNGVVGNVNEVIWNGVQFVAVGTVGVPRISTSPDGITWTSVYDFPFPINTSDLYDIVWNGSQYVVVGTVDSGTNSYIATSPDLLTWTSRVHLNREEINAVTWNGDIFAAVARTKSVLTSTDGINWVLKVSEFFKILFGIVWADSIEKFVAVGQNGTIITSE